MLGVNHTTGVGLDDTKETESNQEKDSGPQETESNQQKDNGQKINSKGKNCLKRYDMVWFSVFKGFMANLPQFFCQITRKTKDEGKQDHFTHSTFTNIDHILQN